MGRTIGWRRPKKRESGIAPVVKADLASPRNYSAVSLGPAVSGRRTQCRTSAAGAGIQNSILMPTCPSRPGSTCVTVPKRTGFMQVSARLKAEAMSQH